MQKILNKEELGQVFTPENVAQLMSHLLLYEENTKGKTILDPCTGKNVFLRTIEASYDISSSKLFGIEIDEEVADKNFFIKNKKLTIMDFFDLSLTRKFDYIIMNPPYVRHEILNNSNINNKEKLEKAVGNDINLFKGRANLYIYFFIKALKHLKKGGKLVAITYDSWLYTEYGDLFKEYLKSNYQIRTLLHFRKSVFADANIGATVIEVVNDKSEYETKYIELDSADEIPQVIGGKNFNNFVHNFSEKKVVKNEINFETSFFETIAERFPKARRGIETLGNKFFYVSEDEKLPFTHKVIKNIKQIKNFIVEDNFLNNLLIIQKEQINSMPEELINYLSSIKIEIQQSNENYLSLRKKIYNDDSWFVSNIVQPGDIIFNYYFRARVDFILNPRKILAANNFYILDSGKPYLDLALLNSTFTKISISNEARDQGRGLKKIQLYEFRKVKVPNESILTNKQKKQLIDLGIKLTETPRHQEKPITNEIDKLLIDAYNQSSEYKLNFNELMRFSNYE
jgi:hypothetical protein